MTAAKFIPIDPETEIDSHGIRLLSGASQSKVFIVMKSDKWGFPKMIRKGTEGIYLYSLAEVKSWLADNDLKAMKFTNADRKPGQYSAAIAEDQRNHDIKKLLSGTGNKAPKFSGKGKTITVQLKERDDYTPPDPRLSRFSNSGAEHRISSACGWQ